MKDIIILCISGALLAPSKIVYIPICFLCLLIPKERFIKIKTLGMKKVNYICTILTCDFVFFVAGSLLVIGDFKSKASIIPWNNEPGYTISYFISHPMRLAEVILNTISLKSSVYLDTMIGKYLGWLNINIPSIIIYGFIIILVLSSFKAENEKDSLDKIGKYILFTIIILTISLTCISMLLGWTPISLNYIEGVQGRYFIPILPLILLLFRNNVFITKYNSDKLIVCSVWSLQIITILSIFIININTV
jgi:uncharacterized membrane protein